jgi:hypothetical protein
LVVVFWWAIGQFGCHILVGDMAIWLSYFGGRWSNLVVIFWWAKGQFGCHILVGDKAIWLSYSDSKIPKL